MAVVVVVVVVFVVFDVLGVGLIGSDGVADATAVTLHPKTINVDVKSCAIRPLRVLEVGWVVVDERISNGGKDVIDIIR